MYFSDIIGQATQKQLLQQLVDNERIPHAQLLLGPQGSGGLPLAIAFAQYVLCENRQANDSCGTCRSCHKVSRFVHPDVHYSYPTIGAKKVSTDFVAIWRQAMGANPYLNANQWLQKIDAENKQGNINVDECQAIARKLSLKTFEAPYKILILWLPEYLGKEGNRLLKLIEEPPDDTLFLLVAENQELILNTVLSRCQLIKINPLSNEEVAEGLLKRGVLGDRAHIVAQLSDGNLSEAIQLAASAENDNANLFLEWLRKCYKGWGPDLLQWVEQFATIGREQQKYFLRYGLHFLREYMLLKCTGDATSVRLLPKELETAQNLTKVIQLEQITPIMNIFDDCSTHVERNANPKVLFLNASIKLSHILRQK